MTISVKRIASCRDGQETFAISARTSFKKTNGCIETEGLTVGLSINYKILTHVIESIKRMKINKAVIAAAGFGTRFLPATKAVPKELLPLIDKPIIQYVVEEGIRSGIRDFVLKIRVFCLRNLILKD